MSSQYQKSPKIPFFSTPPTQNRRNSIYACIIHFHYLLSSKLGTRRHQKTVNSMHHRTIHVLTGSKIAISYETFSTPPTQNRRNSIYACIIHFHYLPSSKLGTRRHQKRVNFMHHRTIHVHKGSKIAQNTLFFQPTQHKTAGTAYMHVSYISIIYLVPS